MHALIRGKDLRMSSGFGSSKILTHKRDAHIEAHFLKTVKKFLQASFKWGDKVGRQCDKLTKLNFLKLMWC